MKRLAGVLIAFLLLAAAPANDTKLVEGGGSNYPHKAEAANKASGNAVAPISTVSDTTGHEAAKVNEKSGNGEKETGWLGIPFDGWVAIFTGVLAFVTIPLAIGTIIAAIAARNAAKALPALERAYIFIQQTSSDSLKAAVNGRYASPILLQYVMNVGRTPAIIKTARCVIAICATPEEVAASTSGKTCTEWIIAPNTAGRLLLSVFPWLLEANQKCRG